MDARMAHSSGFMVWRHLRRQSVAWWSGFRTGLGRTRSSVPARIHAKRCSACCFRLPIWALVDRTFCHTGREVLRSAPWPCLPSGKSQISSNASAATFSSSSA